MAIFKNFIVASVLFGVVLSAPAEVDSDDLAFAQERSVDVVNEDWMWGLGHNVNYREIAVNGGAVALVLAGIALAVYNFYYLKYVTQTSEVVVDAGKSQMLGYPWQYGRSLETSGNWNFTTVLEYIEVAQKTYEGFDVQDKECQKKVLCELVQTNNPIATEVGRQLSDSSLSGMIDSLRGFPVPQVIQVYLEEYNQAICNGKKAGTVCADVYPGCKFSIQETLKNAGSKDKQETNEKASP